MRRLLSRVALWLAMAAALVAALFLLAALVTDEGSAIVAAEGQSAIQAEATLSAASGIRSGTNQAMLLMQGVSFGWVGQSSLTSLLAELAAATEEFEDRAKLLEARLEGEEATTFSGLADAFATATDSVLAHARAGNSFEEAVRADAAAQDAYSDLVGAVANVRNERISSVLAPAESVGRTADAIRFLVVFVIPVVGILLFRRATRRSREREGLKRELARQTEINTARDEFIANLSHELRTPLTSIYGFALALDESGVADRRHAEELIGLIVNEASELSRMVDDLVTAGRLEAGQLTFDLNIVDLDAELEQVLNPFRRQGATISVWRQGGLAWADPLRVRQIVRNLVSNACKHGGDRVSVQTFEEPTHVGVRVIDDGPGVDPGVEARLFSRYVHEGTAPLLVGSIGLGLAIARTLAVEMGGTLEYSRDDAGTCFELRLPHAPTPTDGHEVLDAVGADPFGLSPVGLRA